MKSLFDEDGNAEMVQRLEALVADAKPGWGKLTCTKMLAHCRQGLRVASGELQLKRALIGRLLGGFAKKKYITGDAPFPRNSPTDPKFLVDDTDGFEEERTKLVEALKGFRDRSRLTKGAHPFFGKLDENDWDRLMAKHLDHHLRQFGV